MGLADFGRPEGYLKRQVPRWRAQLEGYSELPGYPGPAIPGLEEVARWLETQRPSGFRPGILHGDYHLANVMFSPRGPQLVAIVDWELSTIGDPLADVGYLTVTWAEADDPQDTMFANLSAVTRRDGFLTREELIARYEERTGRSVSALNWYQALALWKAAVFMEGNYKRFQAGASDDEYLGLFGRGVPMLAEKAREIAHS